MNTAQTIFEQLGGNRFIAMTGAKNLMALNDERGGLGFKIGRGAKAGITHVRVILTDADLYRVEFFKVRGVNVTPVATETSVYADALRGFFKLHTGFETSL